MPLKLNRAKQLKGVNVFIQPCLFHDTNHFNAEFVSSTQKQQTQKQLADKFSLIGSDRVLSIEI